jgi:hypothetical protein
MSLRPNPEVHISTFKVRLQGAEAIKAAGWTVKFAIVCRIVGALLLPWLPYLLWRWSG